MIGSDPHRGPEARAEGRVARRRGLRRDGPVLLAVVLTTLGGCGGEPEPTEPFDPAAGRFMPPDEMLEAGGAASAD